jgi:hypothetical protein
MEYATYPHTNIPYESIDYSPAGIAMSLYMASYFVELVQRNPSQGHYHDYSKPDVYPLVYSYPMECEGSSLNKPLSYHLPVIGRMRSSADRLQIR